MSGDRSPGGYSAAIARRLVESGKAESWPRSPRKVFSIGTTELPWQPVLIDSGSAWLRAASAQANDGHPRSQQSYERCARHRTPPPNSCTSRRLPVWRVNEQLPGARWSGTRPPNARVSRRGQTPVAAAGVISDMQASWNSPRV